MKLPAATLNLDPLHLPGQVGRHRSCQVNHVLADPEVQTVTVADAPRQAIQVVARPARAIGKRLVSVPGQVDEDQSLAHAGRYRIVAMGHRPVLRRGIRLEPKGVLDLVAVGGKALPAGNRIRPVGEMIWRACRGIPASTNTPSRSVAAISTNAGGSPRGDGGPRSPAHRQAAAPAGRGHGP